MAEGTFSCDAMVRGYHVYKDIWVATDGEFLQCARETNNIHDPFAVAVLKDNIIVGHIPKKVSAVCSLFLRRSGSIVCHVNGSRRYSSDLPQGGLEIPCKLIFTGNLSKIDKVRKLVKPEIITVNTTKEAKNNMFPKKGNEVVNVDEDDEKEGKRRKIDHDSEIEWVHVESIILKQSDKATVQEGQQLNDMHLNISQKLLRKQFPLFKGFHCTLVQSCVGNWIDNYIDIFHCRGNHWICVSTIGCKHEEVNVYDSLYKDVDDITIRKIGEVFASSGIKCVLPCVQKQHGINDCGLFAIAFATYLAFGNDPKALETHQFKQTNLRSHLISCLEQKHFTQFP